MKVVIIGVAAGPKVASRIIRLAPDAEVTIVEKGKLLSYAGCGLPYCVSGVVKDQAELMSTPVGVVRDPVFFHKVKNVHVLNQTEAINVDRTGQPCYVPLGSTANKQGRVAANNICGLNDAFHGVLGSTVCKVFDYCVGRTGLTEAAAGKLGYETVTALAPAPDKAHFMPGAKPLLLKLLADKKSRRLLGLQAAGPGVGDKRIDVAATAIAGGMTVDQLANADLCYAPPYAPAMDNIITAANVARNKLGGLMKGVSSLEVHRMMQQGADFVFLDVRSPAEYQQVRLPGSTLIPLGALRGRIDELPQDKEIITFCKVSLRGYEAALILKAAGFEKVRVLDGGIVMWPFEKESGS